MDTAFEEMSARWLKMLNDWGAASTGGKVDWSTRVAEDQTWFEEWDPIVQTEQIELFVARLELRQAIKTFVRRTQEHEPNYTS